jgi:3-isopropylmalate dehydratase small subunit
MAHNKAKAKLDIDTDDLIPVAYKSKQQPEKLEA